MWNERERKELRVMPRFPAQVAEKTQAPLTEMGGGVLTARTALACIHAHTHIRVCKLPGSSLAPVETEASSGAVGTHRHPALRGAYAPSGPAAGGGSGCGQ